MLKSRHGWVYRLSRAAYHSTFERLGLGIPGVVLHTLTGEIGRQGELAYWFSLSKQHGNRLPSEHYERLMCACGNIKDSNVFANKTIVDIGCGPAGSLNWCRFAKYCIGVDPLSEAYSAFDIQNHHMIYLNCPAENIPLMSQSVDIIFAVNSLDHVARPKCVAREIRRLLKTGGYLILSVNCSETGNPREPHRFTLESVVSLFASGFALEWSKMGPHPIAVRSAVGFDGETFRADNPLYGYMYMLHEGPASIQADTTKSHILWCRYRAV